MFSLSRLRRFFKRGKERHDRKRKDGRRDALSFGERGDYGRANGSFGTFIRLQRDSPT